MHIFVEDNKANIEKQVNNIMVKTNGIAGVPQLKMEHPAMEFWQDQQGLNIDDKRRELTSRPMAIALRPHSVMMDHISHPLFGFADFLFAYKGDMFVQIFDIVKLPTQGLDVISQIFEF